MTNVTSKVEGDKLILTIDISAAAQKAATTSKSGKTRVLASTHGFTNINGVGVSLNATVR